MRKILLILLVILTGCDQLQQNTDQELLSRFLQCEDDNDSLRAEIFKLSGKQIDTVWVRDTLTIFDWDTLETIGWDTVWIARERIITEIHPDTVRVDTVTGSAPQNMLDGIPFISRDNRGTRWSVPNYPHWIAVSFDGVQKVDSIEINHWGWDEGMSHQLTIWSWGDSLAQFETQPVKYSGHRIQFNSSLMLIRVDGGDNSWTDIGELRFWRID